MKKVFHDDEKGEYKQTRFLARKVMKLKKISISIKSFCKLNPEANGITFDETIFDETIYWWNYIWWKFEEKRDLNFGVNEASSKANKDWKSVFSTSFIQSRVDSSYLFCLFLPLSPFVSPPSFLVFIIPKLKV